MKNSFLVYLGFVLIIVRGADLPTSIDLDASNKTYALQMPSFTNHTLLVNCSDSYIYIETRSCDQDSKKVYPSVQLGPWSAIYICSNTSSNILNIDGSKAKQAFGVSMFALSDLASLPYHNDLIKVTIGDEYLEVSFSTIKIPNNKPTARYSAWFLKPGYGVHCPILSKHLPEQAVGKVLTPLISSTSQSQGVTIRVPLNPIFPKDVTLEYQNEDEIRGMVNRNQEFFVTIVAEIEEPLKYTVVYEKTKVQRKLNLMDLEIGLLILFLGVAIFAVISCLYLTCRRRFGWREDQFQEQIQMEQASSKLGTNCAVHEEKHAQNQENQHE